jgi:predicted negative regulator of RcsB-dependent stress response
MNSGIVYLMIAPLALIGVVGWRWWKREKELAEAGEV